MSNKRTNYRNINIGYFSHTRKKPHFIGMFRITAPCVYETQLVRAKNDNYCPFYPKEFI